MEKTAPAAVRLPAAVQEKEAVPEAAAQEREAAQALVHPLPSSMQRTRQKPRWATMPESMQKSLAVNAEKKAVNATWTNKDVEINGTISSGSKQLPGGKIYINTTDKAQSDNELTISDLSSAAMDLLNLLSNQNYYLEAVGGSASTVGSSFTGAGSFTVLVMEDTVEALVGNSVVLVQTDGLKVTAASKVNAAVITGSVAYGGSKSAGVAISTIVNNMAVKAALGENVKAGGTVDANGNVTGNMTGDVTHPVRTVIWA